MIGADTLFELHTWKDIGTLLGLCEFVTLARPGFPLDGAADRLRLPEPWPERLLEKVVSAHPVDAASRDIRARVAAGQPINHLVPEAVERYIYGRRLYRT